MTCDVITCLHRNQRVENAEETLVVAVQVGENPNAVAEEATHQEQQEADDLQSDQTQRDRQRHAHHDSLGGERAIATTCRNAGQIR